MGLFREDPDQASEPNVRHLAASTYGLISKARADLWSLALFGIGVGTCGVAIAIAIEIERALDPDPDSDGNATGPDSDADTDADTDGTRAMPAQR